MGEYTTNNFFYKPAYGASGTTELGKFDDAFDATDTEIQNCKDHRTSDGTDHADVVLNNTHRSSDGSDHSFIDQDVTSGSSPTLDGANITGIPDGALDESYVNETNFTQNGGFLVGTGAGTFQEEAGATARASLGLGDAATKGVTGADTDVVTGTAGTTNYTAKWNSDGDLVDGYALTGSDTTLVSGTAGTTNYTAKWNADGDLVDGYEFKDEDDMASDSATAIASQQSIKKYVDDSAGAPANAQYLVGASDGDLSAEVVSQNVNTDNLLLNGAFKYWYSGTSSTPDGWDTFTGAGGSREREASTVKIGDYSCKLTRSGANVKLSQSIHTEKGISYWQGRTVSFSVWVHASVADRAFVRVTDGVANGDSSYHSGGGSWELLTVTLTVDGSATELTAALAISTGDTSAYFDGAMLVEGSIPFAYTEHKEDHLYALELPDGNAGIKFPATQDASADANTLDDYEEGVWIVTITPATSGSVSLFSTYDTGVYRKIGDLVHVQGRVRIDSISSPSGLLKFSLPFTCKDMTEHGGYSTGAIAVTRVSYTADYLVARPVEGQAYFYIREVIDNGATGTLSGSDLAGDGDEYIVFSLSYVATS